MASRRRVTADFPNDKLLSTRDGQRFRHIAQEHFPMGIAIGSHAPLEATDGATRDEAIAVDAHETRTRFLFQLGERFLEQELAVGRAYGNVLELRLEINDFLDRHQHDSRTLCHRQKAARRSRQTIELGTDEGPQARYLL